jgi:hypothetical protein
MKSFFKNTHPSMQLNSSGFGAVINNAINICRYHYYKFGNLDIYIDAPEINNIFDTPVVKNIFEYNYDIEKDFNSANFENSSNAHILCDKEKIIIKNKIYNDIFKLKDIELYRAEKEKFITDKTLSVHVRGTDKKIEIKPPEPNDIINHITKIYAGKTRY